MQNSDPKALGQDGTKLPNKDRSERRDLLFYQDEGGIRATDDYDNPENTLYYLGVIDILTPYNWYKRIEHAWRSCQYDAVRIAMRLEDYASSRLTRCPAVGLSSTVYQPCLLKSTGNGSWPSSFL